MKVTDSVRVRWLRAYVIVVVIMSLLFFLCTLLVMQAVEENAEQVNADNAMFVRNTLDENWDRVFDFSLQIMNNATAKYFDGTEGTDMFTSVQAYELAYEFKNYVLSNSMVEEFFLYYPTSDYVIGNRGVYQSSTYCTALYGRSGSYDASSWASELFGNRTPGYFVIRHGDQLDLYYRMVVSNLIGRVLVAKIDTAELERTLDWISDDRENSFLAMADENGLICAYSGNYEKFVDGETNRLLEVDSRQYLMTRLDSSIDALQYVTIAGQNDVYRLSHTVSRFALLTLLLAFASGLLVSVLLVRRTAHPVEELAARLQPDARGNELELIGSQIDELLAENESRLNALTRQQHLMVGRSFLNECLRSLPEAQRYVETIAAIYGITFEFSSFCMIVRERACTDYGNRTLELLMTADEDESFICWTQRQDLDVFLINFDQPEGDAPSAVQRLTEQLREISGQDAQIVCSGIANNPEEIRTCYLGCLRQLRRVGTVTAHGESVTQLKTFQGQSVLNTFFRCLYDRAYSHALELVEDVWEDYIMQSDGLERACRKYYVLLNLLPLRENVGGEALERLAGTGDDVAWREQLRGILVQAMGQTQNTDDCYENDLAGRIRVFIDKNYDNPMLDLRMLSDELGVSQSYASRMFKQKYGIGTSNYINTVRIAHAKELIRLGQQSIKTVAIQVGFSSDVQFIRVFKKLENVTPGVFRDSNKN